MYEIYRVEEDGTWRAYISVKYRECSPEDIATLQTLGWEIEATSPRYWDESHTLIQCVHWRPREIHVEDVMELPTKYS